jgi:hypothetical protein
MILSWTARLPDSRAGNGAVIHRGKSAIRPNDAGANKLTSYFVVRNPSWNGSGKKTNTEYFLTHCTDVFGGSFGSVFSSATGGL